MEWTIHWKHIMHDEEMYMGGEECEGVKRKLSIQEKE